MPEQVYDRGRWFYDPIAGAFCHTKAGFRDPAVRPEFDYEIRDADLDGLVEAITAAGRNPHLTRPEDRAEDVKIINKLLDIVADAVAQRPDLNR